jgi:predicted RNA binding protein YcfA (HicA-like mRNA interferase family)
MAKTPIISRFETVKRLSKHGWKPVRQTGSHVIMVKEGCEETLSIPQHKTLKKGLLNKILKDAKIKKL